jgi:hypothetical protein
MKKRVFIIFCLVIIQWPLESLAQTEHCSSASISFEIDLLEWNEVDLLLPKYSKFTVIDIESGRSFRVQRRAGRDHTDVQPLTKKDTKIMKQIFGGKWTWKRRAILVQVDDYLIPASMHGMPHGAGVIQNNFPGHFCIHFYGSSTHKSEHMDYSHKLMILKSAGKLDDYVAQSSLSEQIQIFIEALNQRDPSILNLTLTSNWNQNREFKKMVHDIETIKIKRIVETPDNQEHLLVAEAQVEVTMYTKSEGKVISKLYIQLSKSSPIGQWKIHHEGLLFHKMK